MGDLWAGAEVQLATLMRYLIRYQECAFFVVLFNEGRLATALRAMGVSVRVISESRYGLVGLVIQLVRLFRQIRPQIVHTHKYKDNIAGMLAARLAGVAHVVRMVHGLPEPFGGLKGLKMICYVALDLALSRLWTRRFVAVSSSIAAFLSEKFVAERIICIHNGIDLERAQIISEKGREIKNLLRLEVNEIVIGSVGRLSSVKAQDQLLRAAQQLIVAGHKLRVLLVGEGPMEQSLKELTKHLNLVDFVVFTGHQERVADYLGVMDVFVLPSLNEGIPMALLEALAMERPVVATRVGGVPEVIEHGVNGLLVDPADTLSLVRAIRELIEDRSKAIRLGKAGRARIVQEFSANLMAARMLGMYRGLLKDVVTTPTQ
jgi:glycosyltransferase involved in cell wall biosynthesis